MMRLLERRSAREPVTGPKSTKGNANRKGGMAWAESQFGNPPPRGCELTQPMASPGPAPAATAVAIRMITCLKALSLNAPRNWVSVSAPKERFLRSPSMVLDGPAPLGAA